MKSYALIAALFVGMTSQAFASCDVRKADEDKQAKCAEKCDDAFISGKMHYNADLAKVAADKKACDAACGCPQNTQE